MRHFSSKSPKTSGGEPPENLPPPPWYQDTLTALLPHHLMSITFAIVWLTGAVMNWALDIRLMGLLDGVPTRVYTSIYVLGISRITVRKNCHSSY